MTQIVVGVDNTEAHRPVLGMLERLDFPEPHITLIHVAAERMPFAPTFGDVEAIEDRYATVTANLGRAALHKATTLASSKDLPSDAQMVRGNAAECLIREAEARKVDLIAVNAKNPGGPQAGMMGSVGRALAIGSQTSVLFARDQARHETFQAVYATDHSPFAARCLDRFLELAPKGIKDIHVLSAWEIDDREAELLGTNLAMMGGDADRWIEEALEEKNLAMCKRLEEAGYQTHSMVRRGKPGDVIRQAMADVAADLLIVGSQGRGAMDRAWIGSVSLRQATAESYPVLIVRPKEAGTRPVFLS
ncbi:universal stress protein [soil metagenome]